MSVSRPQKCRAYEVYTGSAVAFAGQLVNKLLKLWNLQVRVARFEI